MSKYSVSVAVTEPNLLSSSNVKYSVFPSVISTANDV